MTHETAEKAPRDRTGEGPEPNAGPGPGGNEPGPAVDPGCAGEVDSPSRSDSRRVRSARRPVLAGRSADNQVTLRGTVSSAPVVRELPSGAVISTFRVSVQRARTVMTAGSTRTADWVDCAAWSAGTRRRVDSWAVGDEVGLAGALRRRFFRAGVAPSTRLELEVLEARRSRPADRGQP